jgi:hypothetical protein
MSKIYGPNVFAAPQFVSAVSFVLVVSLFGVVSSAIAVMAVPHLQEEFDENRQNEKDG